MFVKLVILTTLSLVSIATAMTLDDKEKNSNQLAVVAAGTAIEQVVTEQAGTEHATASGQIVTAIQKPAADCAINAVYYNPDLWKNIRSYLERKYSYPSDVRISKLLALNK